MDLEEKGEDDEETVYFDLEVPADAEAGDYTLYVKAYDDEDEHCYMDSVSIDIKRYTHDMVIDSIELPDSVECDSYFDMTIKIVNTGDKDEEDAKIRIYNTQLGIDESKTFDLDKGDYKKVKLSLRVPKDAEEKNYTLTINVLYDEDDGIYGESKTKLATLKIEGNCFVPSYSAVLTAQPVSQPYQEEQFVLKIKIKNTGNIKTNYTVNVSGYDDWATLDKIEPEKKEIEKDEEEFVYVYLTPLEGALGIKKLTAKISYAGKTSEEEVSINIQQSEITRWTGKVVKAFKENKPLVTINAILVIAIIVLAVLLIGKKTRRTWGRREGSARERERRWHEDIE